MSDGYLSIEHGQLSLGGKLIPGILVFMSVGNDVRFDTAEADNLSGKKKTPMGWNDSDLSIELNLLTDADSSCYEKLEWVNGIFKGMDNASNPKVYNITNAHAIARGVNQVVFSSLYSRENNEDDVIRVQLEFNEHNPPTILPEIRAAGAGKDVSPTPQLKQKTEVKADAALTVDIDSPFDKGFNTGLS